MRNRIQVWVIQVAVLALLIACSGGLPWTAVATTTPTARPTPIPTETALPTAEANCSPAAVLDDLQGLVPYEQTASHFMVSADYGLALFVWFVNPMLDSGTGPLAQRIDTAIKASDTLVDSLLSRVPCLATDFDIIETIEVDSSYTGWVSVDYSNLASGPVNHVGYEIDEEPVPLGDVPAGHCSWQDARAEALAVSVPDSNRAVYLVHDRAGTNIWVLWSRPEDLVIDPEIYYLTISLDMPLRFGCLYPEADTLWLVMKDPDGFVLQAQLISGETLRGQP